MVCRHQGGPEHPRLQKQQSRINSKDQKLQGSGNFGTAVAGDGLALKTQIIK